MGLCRLQEQVLPPSWGFTAGSLPPIGASPDALIRHPLPANNLQAAAAAADAPAAAAVGPWDIDGLLARLQLAGSNSNGAAGSSSGGASGCSSNTNGTSGSSTLSNSSARSSSTSSRSKSSGGYLIEVVEVKNSCPFGHSRRWVDLVTCPRASSGVPGFHHHCCTQRHCCACMHECMHSSLCNWMAWARPRWSCCRGGRLRTSELAVADRGPRQAVLPEWVPQLQLHMLCAGESQHCPLCYCQLAVLIGGCLHVWCFASCWCGPLPVLTGTLPPTTRLQARPAVCW